MNQNRTRFGIGLVFSGLGLLGSIAAHQGALAATFIVLGVICVAVMARG
jgi:hypothetical protein